MRIPRKGTERRQEVEMLCTDMLVPQGASFAENRCGAGLLFDSLCKEITNLTNFQADVISLSRYFGRLDFRHAAKRCVS